MQKTWLQLSEVQNQLSPEPAEDFLPAIRQQLREQGTVTVVLDDDPTGTQTVHGITVLTDWSVALLKEELEGKPLVFYILTNSRALPEPEAISLNKQLAQNLREAARQTQTEFSIVSRGDSTLRGHFPAEPEALCLALGWEAAVWVLAPALLEAGRFTVGGIHYVREGDNLVPVGETPFAQDPSFSFASSSLAAWVEEKTGGRRVAKEVVSFDVETIRKTPVEKLTKDLVAIPAGGICVLNAFSYADLYKMSLALRLAEGQGKRFLYRCAASLAKALVGMEPKPLLLADDLPLGTGTGGLVVVGSYVPKTTAQLEALKKVPGLFSLEVSVPRLLEENPETYLQVLATEASRRIQAGQTVVLGTSRNLHTGTSASENLEIGRKVSRGLVEITNRLEGRPAFILAKGGITSSDLATAALQIRRAEVVGQIQPGVPVWLTGPESRFPGLAYIVFPGNVGSVTTLADTVSHLMQGSYNPEQSAAPIPPAPLP